MTNRFKKIIGWFAIGAVGIIVAALIDGQINDKFFYHGAWWTFIYVGATLALVAIFCNPLRDDKED